MALPEKRWIQRFDNYEKAVAVLDEIYLTCKENELTMLEQMALIQAFEFSFELAWKVMKDFLNSKGFIDIMGSKDSIRKAFSVGIIEDGEVWMDMIERRNETSHTYDEKIANKVATSILNFYVKEFKNFIVTMKKYKEQE